MTRISWAGVFWWSCALIVLVCAVLGWQHHQRFRPVQERTSPLYITPQINGLDLSDPSMAARLRTTLDQLEPEGAQGNVRIGYTLTLPLYRFFVQRGQQWGFDEARLEQTLRQAADLRRPFVVYLAADHFFGDSAYGQYLASRPESVMRFAQGDAPKETYFETGIVPFRISQDTSLPHIAAKYEALQKIGRALAVFAKEHPELVVGVALNGETHYMFEHFFTGTGEFTHPRYTDMSDGALRDFEVYLKTHAPKLQAQAASIRNVDLRRYAWGSYPLFGWYCPTSADEKVVVYHQGKQLGEARMQLNRMDVYHQFPKLHAPLCGFRYKVDFHDWPQGTHRVEVFVQKAGKRYNIDNGQLLLTVGAASTPPAPLDALPFKRLKSVGYVDHGLATPVKVAYAPIARAWMAFRADALVQHAQWMADTLQHAGVPASLLFSYQIPAWLNGEWNTALFGVGEDFFLKTAMNPGITLYGGNSFSPQLLRDLPAGKAYGVPEFHLQMAGEGDLAMSTLLFHAQHGARFISPYFMKLIGSPLLQTDHDKMMIDPNNPSMGSNDLYRAIKEMAAY